MMTEKHRIGVQTFLVMDFTNKEVRNLDKWKEVVVAI